MVAQARRVVGRNGGKSRVGTGVKRLEAVATAVAVAAAAVAVAAEEGSKGERGDYARCGWRKRGRRGGGSSTTGQFEYPGEHGDERG